MTFFIMVYFIQNFNNRYFASISMLSADDLVLCDREADGMEDRLEAWRKHLEDAGLKLSKTKAEYMPPTGATIKIKLKNYNQHDHSELPETTAFKFLGTMIDQDGGCGAEIAGGLVWLGTGGGISQVCCVTRRYQQK